MWFEFPFLPPLQQSKALVCATSSGEEHKVFYSSLNKFRNPVMFLFPSHLFFSKINFSKKTPNSSKYELERLLSCSSSSQSSTEDHVPMIDNKILTRKEMNNSFSM